jgi:hypothetical protein
MGSRVPVFHFGFADERRMRVPHPPCCSKGGLSRYLEPYFPLWVCFRCDQMQTAAMNADQASQHGPALYKSNFNSKSYTRPRCPPPKIAESGAPRLWVHYGKGKIKSWGTRPGPLD